MKRSLLLGVLLAAGVNIPALHGQLLANPDTAWLRVRSSIAANNPELVARRSALAAAVARVGATGNAPAAELSAELEEGGRSTRIGLGRELWSGGRRSAERAVVDANVARYRAEAESAERRLGVRADQLLLTSAGHLAAAERLAAADSLLAAAEEALRSRLAVGEARYAHVLRLRAERLRVQGDRVTRSSRADAARLALLALVSPHGPDDSLAATLDFTIRRAAADSAMGRLLEPPALDTLSAWSRRVRLADADIAHTRATLALAQAGRNPALFAGIGVQRFETAGNYRLGPVLSASLTLPFTSTGPRRGVAAAELDIRRAEAGRVAAATDARTDAHAALARYRNATDRLRIYDTSLLRGAREEREAALAAFRAGDVSLLELLDFEVALTHAEIARIDAGAEAMDALARLMSGETHDTDPTRDGSDR